MWQTAPIVSRAIQTHFKGVVRVFDCKVMGLPEVGSSTSVSLGSGTPNHPTATVSEESRHASGRNLALEVRPDGLHSPKVWSCLQNIFAQFCVPEVDMFTSPRNARCQSFCARWPHDQAYLVNALQCPLDQVRFCYAKPLRTVISQWLHRLRQNPHLTICFWIGKRLHIGIGQRLASNRRRPSQTFPTKQKQAVP